MNKFKNKLFVVLAFIITFFGSLGMMNVQAAADNMPDTITITSNNEIIYIYGGMKNGHIAALYKQAGSGYVYCIEPQLGTLKKETLTFAGELTDPGYLALAKYGFPNARPFPEGDDKQNYYVTQIAHWIYAYVIHGWKDGDKIVGHIIDGSGNKHFSFSGSYSDNLTQTKLANAAYNLYTKAKAAHDSGTTSINLGVSASASSNKLERNNNILISKPVSVNISGASSYTVSVTNGTIIDENGEERTTFNANETFRVKTSYKDKTETTATITVNGSQEKVYKYKPSSASKQAVLYSVVNNIKINKTTSVDFNYEAPEVLISKVDATTGNELPGAHLEIRDMNNGLIESWVSTKSIHKIKLNPGTYKLIETIAPDKYLLSKKEVTFTVREDGTCDKVVMENKPVDDVLISKVDATTGNELPGAHLEIRDMNDGLIESWVSTKKVHNIKLNPGTYKLIETIAPDKYLLSKKEITFTVREDGTSDKVVMENKPVDDVLISKVDATTGSEIAGAHLEIRDMNDGLIESWTSTTSVHKIKLNPGTYKLIETIAPNDYILATEEVEFTVREDGTSDKVVMKNKPLKSLIEISKVDASTGNELPGATLVLTDSEGNPVEEWISTEEVHKIMLKDGVYTLTETIAPENYEISTESITFEVIDGKVATPVVMINHPYHEVPITDMNASTSKILLGSMIILLGSSMLVLKLRKEY